MVRNDLVVADMKPTKVKKTKRSATRLGKEGSSRKSGMPPGSLIHIGQVKMQKVRFDLIEYNAESFAEKKNVDFEELVFDDKSTFKWLRVIGLHDIALIDKVGKKLGLHNLLLEDILNTGQRPKLDTEPGFVFLTLKTLYQENGSSEISSDQISMVLQDRLLISFQESDLAIFDPLFERFNNPMSRLRLFGTDYLFYAITDLIVDEYFKVIENLGESIDHLEDNLPDMPDKQVSELIQQNRKDLLFVKKSIFPLREAVMSLLKSDHPLVDPNHNRYFGDVQDHVMQMVEIIETYRELNSGIRDIFLSAQSYRMNQVMKVLTIIGTIFIPLTFIVGVYGMNFEIMPELKWTYGYAGVWIVMIIIVVIMLLMFKRRKWL
jgi:magnesium transporter